MTDLTKMTLDELEQDAADWNDPAGVIAELLRRYRELEGEAECAVDLRDRVLALESELSERPLWCVSCAGDGYTESHEGAITHACRTCNGSGMLRPVTR
jgi:DnaJ-class molecular chaperone